MSHTPQERGAVSIMVVLMLLVLLTISSIGMSRNALRSAIASGTQRQAHMAENTADAGLEWAIYWMSADPNTPPKRAAPAGAALALQTQMLAMQAAGAYGTAGATLTPAAHTEFSIPSTGAATLTYDVTLNLIGQTTPNLQGFTPGASSPTAPTATSLNLWTVTTNGYVAYPGGPTFVNRREAWVTIPPS